jgi:Protein of unknown function (DUF2442)
MLIKVVQVKPLENYRLEIAFNTGEVKIFDCNYLINRGVFQNFTKHGFFQLARVEYGTVTWPNNIDIDPETLYSKAV